MTSDARSPERDGLAVATDNGGHAEADDGTEAIRLPAIGPRLAPVKPAGADRRMRLQTVVTKQRRFEVRTRRIGAVLALVGTVVAGQSTTLAAASSSHTTVDTGTVHGLGTVLVSSGGRTLYRFTADSKGSSSCNGPCAAAWPPLLVVGKPTAGKGVAASKLGTIKRAGGKLQVTYGGYPLYAYAGDSAAGNAKGEGIGSSWYAVAASGALVKSSTTPATPSATTTTGGGGGGGY